MNKLFYNSNGNTYYILFGGKGQKSFLCNIKRQQFVICAVLEENSWWHGNYFENFEEAYKSWKGNENNEQFI